MLAKVEGDGAVVDLHVGHLDRDILELDMLPGQWGVVDHDHGRIVVLIIGHVQEHQLLPVAVFLAHAYEARDVEARAEQFQVLHQLGVLVPASHSKRASPHADQSSECC